MTRSGQSPGGQPPKGSQLRTSTCSDQILGNGSEQLEKGSGIARKKCRMQNAKNETRRLQHSNQLLLCKKLQSPVVDETSHSQRSINHHWPSSESSTIMDDHQLTPLPPCDGKSQAMKWSGWWFMNMDLSLMVCWMINTRSINFTKNAWNNVRVHLTPVSGLLASICLKHFMKRDTRSACVRVLRLWSALGFVLAKAVVGTNNPTIPRYAKPKSQKDFNQYYNTAKIVGQQAKLIACRACLEPNSAWDHQIASLGSAETRSVSVCGSMWHYALYCKKNARG